MAFGAVAVVAEVALATAGLVTRDRDRGDGVTRLDCSRGDGRCFGWRTGDGGEGRYVAAIVLLRAGTLVAGGDGELLSLSDAISPRDGDISML